MNKWPPNRPLTFKPRNRDRLTSIREFEVDNGETIIALFQGDRGQKPDLDILVKYLQRGSRLRTPQHLHWAIDLLIKKQHKEALTVEFADFLIKAYDRMQPFSSLEDRAKRLAYQIGTETNEAIGLFGALDAFGEYSVEFTYYILEIMSIAEKTGNPDAFMFRGVLSSILKGEEIFRVVSAASFRGN